MKVQSTKDVVEVIVGDSSVYALSLVSGVPNQTIYNYRNGMTNPLKPVVELVTAAGYRLEVIKND